MACAFHGHLRSLGFPQGHKIVLVFSSRSFIFYVYVYNTFWINFCVWCNVKVTIRVYLCGYPIVSAPSVGRLLFSFIDFPWCFVKIKWWYRCGSISGLYSRLLVCISDLMPISQCLENCRFIVSLGNRWCKSFHFYKFFPLKSCFGICGLLHFRISMVNFDNIPARILIGITWNL